MSIFMCHIQFPKIINKSMTKVSSAIIIILGIKIVMRLLDFALTKSKSGNSVAGKQAEPLQCYFSSNYRG